MLTSLVPVLFTFYIQVVLKLKKNNSGAKTLKYGKKQFKRFLFRLNARSVYFPFVALHTSDRYSTLWQTVNGRSTATFCWCGWFPGTWRRTKYYQSFIYSPTDALVSSLKKKTILKFTLKQLRHVSVLQLHNHQGGHNNLCLLKLQLLIQSVKIHRCVVNTAVVWLHILGPYWCPCVALFLKKKERK